MLALGACLAGLTVAARGVVPGGSESSWADDWNRATAAIRGALERIGRREEDLAVRVELQMDPSRARSDRTRAPAVDPLLPHPLAMGDLAMRVLQDAASARTLEARVRLALQHGGFDPPEGSLSFDAEDPPPVADSLERLARIAGQDLVEAEREAARQQEERLSPPLRRALRILLAGIGGAATTIQEGLLADAEPEDVTAILQGVQRFGVEGDEALSDEEMLRFADLVTLVADLDSVLEASVALARAVDLAMRDLEDPAVRRGTRASFRRVFHATTPLGEILVSGTGRDRHEGPALLLVDLGGADLYEGPVASTRRAPPPSAPPSHPAPGEGGGENLDPQRASLLAVSRLVSVVIDLAGGDHYACEGDFAQGSGVLGLGFLVDLEGNDVYEAGRGAVTMGPREGEPRDLLAPLEGGAGSQGAGWLGVGVLWDAGGDDRYRAGDRSQAAGVFGVGVLADDAGRDAYAVSAYGQGFGGSLGVGWLQEGGGDDLYRGGGRYPDAIRDASKTISFTQGAGYGQRLIEEVEGGGIRIKGEVGGGAGFLIDLAGNDRYQAEIFGQGTSYWTSLGLLLDAAGNDVYDCWRYGQGAGTHVTVGGLFDLGGDDRYSIWGVGQGCGHDFSTGILFDRAGNDIYQARAGLTQGFGNARNGCGILVDLAGNDRHEAPSKCLGATGDNPDVQEPRGAGLFLDLGGRDSYAGREEAGEDRTWTAGQEGLGRDASEQTP